MTQNARDFYIRKMNSTLENRDTMAFLTMLGTYTTQFSSLNDLSKAINVSEDDLKMIFTGVRPITEKVMSAILEHNKLRFRVRDSDSNSKDFLSMSFLLQ